MERQFGAERYWTTYFADNKLGCAGLRLHRGRGSDTEIAAEVTYWDSTGNFAVKTIDGDVPIEIMEEAFADARQRVRVR